MKNTKTINNLIIFILLGSITSCRPAITSKVLIEKDYLLKVYDTTYDSYGYVNLKGDTIIPLGKYAMCFTDTFRTYAIVVKPNVGFVAIDRQESVLYEVFPFDNGPDEPSDGLFRIIENGKIGYADSLTGKVVIIPQFDCAWPFENGLAQVSNDCKTLTDGEHSSWISDHWYYIDKRGKIDEKPETTNE